MEELQMSTIEFNKELFAKHLREFRGEKSQAEIAEILGINNRTTISLLENKKVVPTLEVITSFCENFNTSIDLYFIHNENEPVMLMMGQLKETDKQLLANVIDRIKIRERYISINKRCEKQ